MAPSDNFSLPVELRHEGGHLKALFDALLLDLTVLDEVLAAYGLCAVPLAVRRDDDLRVASGVAAGLSKLIESAADGCRDHNETLAVAALLRPHMGG